MQSDLEEKGWKVYLVPYEVSSRGQILKTTKSSIIFTLKQFKIKIKAEQLLFKQLSKIALLSTFSIFHAYQTKEWVSPPLLTPLNIPGTGLQLEMVYHVTTLSGL